MRAGSRIAGIEPFRFVHFHRMLAHVCLGSESLLPDNARLPGPRHRLKHLRIVPHGIQNCPHFVGPQPVQFFRFLRDRAKITSHFGWGQCVVPGGKSFVRLEWQSVKFSIGDSFAFFVVLSYEAGADAKSGRGFCGSDVTVCGFVTV